MESRLFGGYLQEVPRSHLIIRAVKGCQFVFRDSLAPFNQFIGLLLLSHYLYVGFVVANVYGWFSWLSAAGAHAQIDFFGDIKMPKSFLNPGQFPICLTFLGFALSLQVQPTCHCSILRPASISEFSFNLLFKGVKIKTRVSSFKSDLFLLDLLDVK